MNITCVIHSLDGGGAERVMAGLASRLRSRGHGVTLITLDDGREDRHTVDPAVRRVLLDVAATSRSTFSAIANNLSRINALRAAIRQSKPDVVLSFCDSTNVLVMIATRGLGIRTIVSERSDPKMQTMREPWSMMRRRLYRRAEAVVVLTRDAAKTVAPWCRNDPIVIPSAVDVPPPSDGTPRNVQSKTILGVGRLEHEKGFDRLVDAFATLASDHPQWNLRIVGEGSLREKLQQQIVAHGIQERVTMPGWVRPIWPEYRHADMFILPSRYEGFPSALLEAMAVGVAVIAVDCESGPREIIRHDQNGWLVPEDPEALAAAMRKLMIDDTNRQRLGASARDVTDRFGWDAMVDAYERVLSEYTFW